ncbi:MAG: hypothetical protein ACXWQO_15490 [Bdellovibrionota bacterium]
MPQNPYREPFKLDSSIQVPVEAEVAECLKVMSDNMKIPPGELVNTAMRRFISTHSDYFPKGFWKNKRADQK